MKNPWLLMLLEDECIKNTKYGNKKIADNSLLTDTAKWNKAAFILKV